MGAINGTEAIPEEWIISWICGNFLMDLIRVGRFEEFTRKTRENILEEVVYVAMKCVITVVKCDLEILIGSVVAEHVQKESKFLLNLDSCIRDKFVPAKVISPITEDSRFHPKSYQTVLHVSLEQPTDLLLAQFLRAMTLFLFPSLVRLQKRKGRENNHHQIVIILLPPLSNTVSQSHIHWITIKKNNRAVIYL